MKLGELVVWEAVGGEGFLDHKMGKYGENLGSLNVLSCVHCVENESNENLRNGLSCRRLQFCNERLAAAACIPNS